MKPQPIRKQFGVNSYKFKLIENAKAFSSSKNQLFSTTNLCRTSNV